MKRIFISALALVGVGAMMPAEVSAQFRVVKDGKAILVMEDEVPDYVDFEVGAQEDGHLTLEELMAMTTVAVDKSADGKNGNVLTCSTTAPVSVKWSIPDYSITSNSENFTCKMGLGEHRVLLSAMCADGTKLNAEYTVTSDVETVSPQRIYIYGEDPVKEPPFEVIASGVTDDMRFSDNEGKHFPYLSDEVYWGLKTLIFDISDTKPGQNIFSGDKDERPTTMHVMNGWWSAYYIDEVTITDGLWELPITKEIAEDCAKGDGGYGKDLALMLLAGSCTVNSVYYYNYEIEPAITTGKAVDLGLSVKWSDVNVGASSPEQSGSYYAWGEIETKEDYSWEAYKYGGYFIGDNRGTLEKADDAASVNWGGDWVIPSQADWMEIHDNCTFEWTNNYNNTEISGFIITSKAEGNHNSIFLPAAGGYKWWDSGHLNNRNYVGYYMSSTLYEGDSSFARYLFLNNNGVFGPDAYDSRCDGYSVRPVCPSAGNANGHDVVDLGLPSRRLWATCNVGADAPQEAGDYFAWGEIESKSYYNWSTYKHMQSGKSEYFYINKYQFADEKYEGIWYPNNNKTTFDSNDDIATTLWGDEWQMPTVEEWEELDANTTKEWTNNYFGTGVSGYILTSTKPGYENAYIFLPAAGNRMKLGLYGDGSVGNYLSSSLSEYNSKYVRCLYFRKNSFSIGYNDYRSNGQSVRPVCTK